MTTRKDTLQLVATDAAPVLVHFSYDAHAKFEVHKYLLTLLLPKGRTT